MKLLTKELEKEFQKIGSQESVGAQNAIVVTKFFHPYSPMTWYATEYNPETRIFFGWVDGPCPELGYFSLEEMESLNVKGMGMERDIHWKPMPLKDALEMEGKRPVPF